MLACQSVCLQCFEIEYTMLRSLYFIAQPQKVPSSVEVTNQMINLKFSNISYNSNGVAYKCDHSLVAILGDWWVFQAYFCERFCLSSTMNVENVSVLFGPNMDHGKPIERIHRIFEKNLKATSAVILNDDKGNVEKIDLKTLNAKANRIANYLLDQTSDCTTAPNADGDYLIGVCMRPSIELILAILSVLKTGAAYVPINAVHRDQVKHILNEAKPMVVICDDSAIESGLFDDFETALRYQDLVDASRSLRSDNFSSDRCFDGGKADIALVLYTSGSTGTPKGARIPHSACLNRIIWQFQEFPYAATETIGVFKTVFSFIDAASEIWGALLSGRSLLVLPNTVTRDPSALVPLLEAYDIQRLVLVPSLLRSILTYLNLVGRTAKRLPNLKLFICSGEMLPKQLVVDFFSYFADGTHTLCNFYGSTEVMGDVTFFICDRENQLVPIGKPISNMNCYIVATTTDPTVMQLAALNETGELCVSGENLARGYVNGRANDRFCSNPFAKDAKHELLYRTGDLARIGADGLLYYEGRSDNQVKIRGHRVDLNQIEVHLSRIENVRQAVVLAVSIISDQRKLVANVMVDCDRRLTGADIEYILRTQLPNYMIPEVFVVNDIPLLPNGKVDRQLLLQGYQTLDDNKSTSIDYADVVTVDLKKAEALFETIAATTVHFSNRKISCNSHFYEIGGDSLNSLYVISQLRDRNYVINVSDFISSKTLADVIERMSPVNSAGHNVSFGRIESDFGFRSEMLSEKHRAEAISVVASSFFIKSDLDKYLVKPATLNDYIETIMAIWQPLVEAGLSFVVFDRDDRIVGAYLLFEAHTAPAMPLIGGVGPLIEIVKENEVEFFHSLPTDRPIIRTFLMGALNVNPARNVGAMAFMEKEATRIATEKEFVGILTTNISPVTKALGQKINGYRIVKEMQVNKYVLKGERPYARAPDSYTITSEWKQL